MASRDKGPVKPPVLDLEANKTGGDAGKHGTGTASGRTDEPAEDTARKTAPGTPRNPVLLSLAAGLGGALAGAVIAWLIAYAGFWPHPAGNAATATLGSDLAALQTAYAGQDEILADLSARLDALTADIDALSVAQPPDLSPLQTRLDTLDNRIDALAAGASPDTAAGLTDDMAALSLRLDAAEQAVTDQGEDLAALQARVAAMSEGQDTATGAGAAQLPLALSGLEAAFATGRPYEGELQVLAAALPDLAIPQEIAAHATSGLPAPDMVRTRFTRAIPAILAARPADPDAGWQETLLARARALLAMRPTGAAEGDSPEALVSRIEAALARADFTAAAGDFAALPQPMQQAAGDLGGDVARLAAAQDFAAAARAAALAPVPAEAGGTS